MKIPALRAKIGSWTYYITTLTFQQISDSVSKIDDELHKSKSLRDLIQRSITNNYLSIKDYIRNQPDLFFNSLVLAAYNDYPNWIEIEVKYDDNETYQIGLLEFPSHHKIFPVDGQHRVEGIKEALKEAPELKDQQVGAIFIGHQNDAIGMERTRRLFTTLNRYAKPVSLSDIIALDEDDIVAITTRSLLEEFNLFTKDRVALGKGKAIPPTNKNAITSIITLYQANLEIFKLFYETELCIKPSKPKIDKYLRYRPSDEMISKFLKFCIIYWESFSNNLSVIKDYIKTQERGAAKYRGRDFGGNLLFRPVGFLPFVKASITIHKRKEIPFSEIFTKMNKINLNINSTPWHNILWNQVENKMIMNSNTITKLMLEYMFNAEVLTESEILKLKEGYASKTSFKGENINDVLKGII